MFVCDAGKQEPLAVDQEDFKCRVMDKGAGLVTYVCKQLFACRVAAPRTRRVNKVVACYSSFVSGMRVTLTCLEMTGLRSRLNRFDWIGITRMTLLFFVCGPSTQKHRLRVSMPCQPAVGFMVKSTPTNHQRSLFMTHKSFANTVNKS